ncbi:hypothetical protein Pmani_026524 [Petrolisthes manimaculis]|uniref:Ion transport domain-containing protein n=1 Tax=Petrolisthes manimaculis TaxID=1843537 RepID=A0AAE1P3Y0_9EUCA|nr:hypothetical protein Pmani_026524 [Petrolisthes manimaculis]
MVRPRPRVTGSVSPLRDSPGAGGGVSGNEKGVRHSHSCTDLSTHQPPTQQVQWVDGYRTHLTAPLVNLGYDTCHKSSKEPVSHVSTNSTPRPTHHHHRVRSSGSPRTNNNNNNSSGLGTQRTMNGGMGSRGGHHPKVGTRMSWSPKRQLKLPPIRPRVFSDCQNRNPGPLARPSSLTRSFRIKQWIQARQRSSSQDTTQLSFVTVEEGDEEGGTGTQAHSRHLDNIREESEMDLRKNPRTKSRRRLGAMTTRRRRQWQSERGISPASETSECDIEKDTNLEERLVAASLGWNTGAIRDHRINALRSCLTSRSQPLTVLNLLEANKVPEAVADARASRSRVLLDVCLLWACLQGASDLIVMLLEAGANADARDSAGFNALHLAAENGCEASVRALLKGGAKVGGAWEWDGNEEMTPLMMAARSGSVGSVLALMEAGAAVDAGLNTSGETALHHAVRAGMPDCVQTLISSGATINPILMYSETPLHIAVCEGMANIVDILLLAGADVRASRGSSKMTALHFAAQEGYCSVAHQLLKAGANPDQENVRGQTSLHLAAKSQSSDTVQLLLSFGGDPNACDRDRKTPLHSGIFKGSRSYECLRLLLEAGADSNAADESGHTPLHMAALHDSSYCVLLFLDHGGDVTTCTTGGVSALNLILRRTPTVQMDFRVLMPGESYGMECRMLSCFIRENQKPLLKHPLCEALLFLKWLRVRSFFVFNLIFYALLVASLTCYIMVVFPAFSCLHLNSTTEETILPPFHLSPSTSTLPTTPANTTTRTSTSGPDDRKEKWEQCGLGYEELLAYLLYFIWVEVTILSIKELFQVMDAPRVYLSTWDNVLVWPIIIFSLTITVTSYVSKDTEEWEHHLAAIVMLLSYVELLLLIGRFPVFGLYVQMFTHVTKNFGKFLFAYLALINAFSLSFGVLFPNHPPFKIYALRLLKTLVMMTGEIEYDDWFFDENKTIMYPGTSHIIFSIFLVFVTIILMNLLVGLAVSDIQGLQKSAGLDRLVRQTQLVAHFESFMFSEWLKWVIPTGILNILHRSILLSPSLYGGTLVLTPKTLRDTGLPPDLVQIILRTARARDHDSRRRNAFANFRTLSKTAQYTSDGDGDVQRSVDALRFGLDLLVWDMDERREESGNLRDMMDALTQEVSSLTQCSENLTKATTCPHCNQQLQMRVEGSEYTSCSSEPQQPSPRYSPSSRHSSRPTPRLSPQPCPLAVPQLSPSPSLSHYSYISPRSSPRCSPGVMQQPSSPTNPKSFRPIELLRSPLPRMQPIQRLSPSSVSPPASSSRLCPSTIV